MTEPQVTASYPQPGYPTQPGDSQQQQGLPPVNQGYPTQPYAYPPQGMYPQQQAGYPTQQTVNPPQQQVYPPQQPGYPPQEKLSPQNEAPPPPYQAGPPQVFLVNTANQPVPGQMIMRTTQQEPNDYLVFAILVTIFCCLPCGIVAIIKASNVRSHFASGNYEAANRSSQEAKKWAYGSCICGLVCDSLIFGYIFLFYVIAPFTWYAAAYDTYNDYSYTFY